MRTVLRAARYLKNHFWELYYFWRYAIPAKLRFFKYQSDKIALIRLDHIGDCVMFLDAAKEINRTYENCEITVICREISRPILESQGIFSKIISLDPNNMDRQAYKKLIQELRRDNYNLFLQPIVSKLFIVDIIAAAVKCNKRISIEPSDDNIHPKLMFMTNFLYGAFIPRPKGNVSEFDNYGAFIRGACNPRYKTALPTLRYKSHSFITEPYYVLYPGGTLSQKFWPAELFAKTAAFIYHQTGMTGVICGSKDEKFVADKLISHLNGVPVVDLTGKTSILEVVDVIGNAGLVISNDTSGVHIAAATGTPSVAIVGGWHFERFLPYHIEHVKPGDKLPMTAYTEMTCYYCNFNIQQSNMDCWKKIDSGGLFECIERVGYEQVEVLVSDVLKGGGFIG